MTWDVDANGQFDALTDGRLILGYLFGLTGEALIGNSIAPDATRREPGEIIAYLESIRDQLDVDGNGIIDALTDAILYLRYLFGFTGEALTRGAVGADATRDGAEQIVAYLESIDNQTTDPNPENDNFANAQEISGVPITSTGQNVSGTKEVDEPNHAGNAGGSSVWWSWTAQSNGSFTITTAGSDFDTVLGVYTGNSLSSLTEIASNDDSEDSDDSDALTSSVTFSAVAGTNYLIAVDGFDGASGNIILSIDSASTVSLSSSKLSSSKTIDLPDLLIGTSASDMLVGTEKENIPMDASDGFMGISNSLTTEPIASVEISDPSNSLTVPIAAGNAVNANLPDLGTNSDDGFATVMSMIVDDKVIQNFPIA